MQQFNFSCHFSTLSRWSFSCFYSFWCLYKLGPMSIFQNDTNDNLYKCSGTKIISNWNNSANTLWANGSANDSDERTRMKSKLLRNCYLMEVMQIKWLKSIWMLFWWRFLEKQVSDWIFGTDLISKYWKTLLRGFSRGFKRSKNQKS